MDLTDLKTYLGNKREVPGNLPVGYWCEWVLEVAAEPGVLGAPWFHPWLEFLTPAELRVVKAKAVIWHEVTGEWPEEIAWWWEIRMARRRGDIGHEDWAATAAIDAQGVLRCGMCGARWSANYDGTPHADRCSLCDRRTMVVLDFREECD